MAVQRMLVSVWQSTTNPQSLLPAATVLALSIRPASKELRSAVSERGCAHTLTNREREGERGGMERQTWHRRWRASETTRAKSVSCFFSKAF